MKLCRPIRKPIRRRQRRSCLAGLQVVVLFSDYLWTTPISRNRLPTIYILEGRAYEGPEGAAWALLEQMGDLEGPLDCGGKSSDANIPSIRLIELISSVRSGCHPCF